MTTEQLEQIAAAAVAYADRQECVYCGQHRVYTHLPGCFVAKFKREMLRERERKRNEHH